MVQRKVERDMQHAAPANANPMAYLSKIATPTARQLNEDQLSTATPSATRPEKYSSSNTTFGDFAGSPATRRIKY